MTASHPIRIVVSRRIFPDILARLQSHFEVLDNQEDAPWSPRDLAERLRGASGLFVTSGEPVDAALLAAAPELRVVSTMAVGYNNIDVGACTARGVLCTNTPGVLTETTADLGFALLMAAARRLAESEHFLRAGKWHNWTVDMFAGSDVHGATLGIIGMGRIGQAIARRGALGFGMPVLYHNRSRLDATIENELHARYASLEELLSKADHVILVLPYSKEAYHLIGAEQIALMKPTATLVNIARGGLVDENALADALAAHRIAAAGLDVFEGEPQVNPRLLALDNVVLTPHVGSASISTRRAMCDLAVDNLIAVLTGHSPKTPINPEAVARS